MGATPYTTVSIDATDRPEHAGTVIAHHDGTLSIYLVDQPGYLVYLEGTLDDLLRWANDLVDRISKLQHLVVAPNPDLPQPPAFLPPVPPIEIGA